MSTLSLSGACQEDVAASTSVRHAGLSQARRRRRQAKIERAQIVLDRSQPGLPGSSGCKILVMSHDLKFYM